MKVLFVKSLESVFDRIVTIEDIFLESRPGYPIIPVDFQKQPDGISRRQTFAQEAL